MEALILSCGTGGGHNSAGIAVKEELLLRGHHVTMLNPYTLYQNSLAKRVDKTYINIAQRAPKVFGAIYRAGDLYRRLPGHSPVYYANGHMAEIVRKFLEEHPVDIIIMPHIFPAEILTYLREHDVAIPKTILISTDYTCIPFAEECFCDACIIPSEKLISEFCGWGIKKEQMYPFGIPVQKCFHSDISKSDAKKALHLDEDKRYLLISGGSIGAGKLKETLDILCEITKGTPYCLIVICGNNASLYKNLEHYQSEHVTILGQTNDMALYLRTCEVFFTKPGGLSTTEAAVMEVPLVLLPPIPGCESKNLRFFTENGMAVKAELSADGLRKILTLSESTSACDKMCRSQRNVIPKDAAENICDLAEKLYQSAPE